MRWLTTLSIALLLYAMLPAIAHGNQVGPPGPRSGADLGVQASIGDSPLTTAYVARGNLNVAVFGLALGAAVDPPGTLTVSGLPTGSSVVTAFFYGSEWMYTAGATAGATLAGVPLGAVSPIAHDPTGTWDLAVYRWDATAVITGNGSYSFTTSGLEMVNGAVLVVVYGNTAEPYRQIVVNEGAESLQVATSTTTFSMDGAGPGVLYLFTIADELPGYAESVNFNGTDIAGPGGIFSGNLGAQASLLSYPVTVVGGDNKLSVTADPDWFGWELAVLAAEVPQPTTPPPPPPDGDRDGDGIKDGLDACPDTNPNGLDANGDGCPDTLDSLPGVVDQTLGVQPQARPSLQAQVSAALAAMNRGNYCAALGSLEAVKSHISAQTGKKITTQAADMLQRYVDNVIKDLRTQMPAGRSC